LRGELSCELLTDFPERFARTDELLVGDPPRPFRLERHRLEPQRVVVKLRGIDDREAAEGLRGALLQVPADTATALPEGSFYWHQIVGLRVEDVGGRELGRVAEILATGSNDVYIVRPAEGRELLLPAIKDVVKAIDLEQGVMVVELLPGLED
jgi:16S rRNA processing protein RimM